MNDLERQRSEDIHRFLGRLDYKIRGHLGETADLREESAGLTLQRRVERIAAGILASAARPVHEVSVKTSHGFNTDAKGNRRSVSILVRVSDNRTEVLVSRGWSFQHAPLDQRPDWARSLSL